MMSLLRYSGLIFLSGTAASFILDIDKSMIYSLTSDVNVAFYAVAIYIAAVIEAPGRAMFQITSPLVAEALNSKNKVRLESLLKKSSINLMIVSGLFVGFSRLEDEDEYISKLRLESLVWSVYANYLVLLIAFLFVNGMSFMWIMIFNMYTILFFFIIRFHWSLYQFKNSVYEE